MSHCLDAWAAIAFIRDELPAAARVQELLAQRPYMSAINLGEVYYVLRRRAPALDAEQAVRELRPHVELDVPTEQLILRAATIKAANRMSYADAFAVATAVAHGVTLATGDPEIIDADIDCAVEDLR